MELGQDNTYLTHVLFEYSVSFYYVHQVFLFSVFQRVSLLQLVCQGDPQGLLPGQWFYLDFAALVAS